MAGQPAPEFAALLRQLRAEAGLTQEQLAEAAGLSPRTVSDLERGVHRLAQQDTARLLADALSLTGSARRLFVAAARGHASADEVLAVRSGLPRDASKLAGRQADVERLLGAVVGSPYRGLKTFEEQDAVFFFGREAVTTELLDRMSRLLGAPGPLVVSGVSGAGKSSLLRAGVLPQLRKAGLAAAPEAASWPCLVFTPTRVPLDELALRVGLLAGADAATVRRGLEADPAGFALTVRQAALAQLSGAAGEPDGQAARDQLMRQRLLLVVDQFEEVFTQCGDDGQRRAFIAALHAAATAGHGPEEAPAALVVLGVRADFEARCADYPQLASAVQDRYLVTSMTERQLRMAITEPARKAGSQVTDDLADSLLSEARTGQHGTFGAGMLPLLSHALDQAWRSRTGNTVTLADYERTGGIEGAVATSAQRTYDALTPGQQVIARQVFTRLAATTRDGLDTADRATRAELTTGKDAAGIQDVEAVLEAFTAERLLTLAVGTIEISHEVLLTAWPLLRDTWLADTHADRIVRTRLRSTAAEWDRHSRDPSYLYSGSLLEAATGTVARIEADPARHPPLSPAERDFLRASGRARRRTVRWRQATVAGLLVVTLIAISTAVIAVRNADTAARQHALALSRQLAAESLSIAATDPVTARRLAVAAWHVSPTSQAGSVMAMLLADQQQDGILPADPSVVWGVAFSPHSNLLATADDDGTVRLWNPATGQAVGAPLRAPGAKGGVYAVAFSPDGKLVAAGGADGWVRLWNLATGRPFGKPMHATRVSGGVYGVAFSPDGTLLASADGYSNTVRLWNPANGQPVGKPLRTGSQNGVFTVTFSPDGTRLAAASDDGGVRLWDPASHLPIGAALKAGGQNTMPDVGFSRNGDMATVTGDGKVRFWDPVTGQPALTPLHPSSPGGVSTVGFSHNGKLLAIGNSNGTVRLWDLNTGVPVGKSLPGPYANIGATAVAFSPGGTLLAATYGGAVQLWDLTTGRPVGGPLPAATAPNVGVSVVAFSPKGKLLAGATTAGVVGLWNWGTDQPVGTPIQTGDQGGGESAMAFSPDGTRLATIAVGLGTLRLYDPGTGRLISTSSRYSDAGGTYGLAFSPDGKLLATAGSDGDIRLWSPVTGQRIGTPHRTVPYAPTVVAYSPNSKMLAIGSVYGRVRLWDPVTGRPLSRLMHADAGPGAVVNGVAFSPNGKLLATAGGHGTVRLWNPANGHSVGAPLPADTAPSGSVNGVAFSPNGTLLASADGDSTVRLWNPATGQPVAPPIPIGTEGVSAVAFSPDGELLATADGDGTVKLWKVSLFRNPYAALCTDVGAPTRQEWHQYAPGEPEPRICA